MADITRTGNQWLEAKRVAWLSVSVSIIPPGSSTPRTVAATVSATNRNVMDLNGAFVTNQFRAFLVSRADLPENPVRGMRLTLLEDGRTVIYEAAPPTEGEPVWQWSDRTQALRKIHCIPVG
jgi:hypothetical protein